MFPLLLHNKRYKTPTASKIHFTPLTFIRKRGGNNGSHYCVMSFTFRLFYQCMLFCSHSVKHLNPWASKPILKVVQRRIIDIKSPFARSVGGYCKASLTIRLEKPAKDTIHDFLFSVFSNLYGFGRPFSILTSDFLEKASWNSYYKSHALLLVLNVLGEMFC